MVFAGEAFVPAQYLRYLDPWRANYKPEDLPPWNGLMYDSVGQFYPWRKFAADSIGSGVIPLWNPYQFCGTPFVANSQSAVFYPGNLLFYILSPATAAGWIVILHLTLTASFMRLFLRGLKLGEGPAVLGGTVFAFSCWQVSWLHLPTFLTTSCWLPLALHLTRLIFAEPGLKRAVQLALTMGVCLLAGHLQIAFYVLLAVLLYAGVILASGRGKSERPNGAAFVLLLLGALGLGGMVAAPQVIPSLELSRRSHRVSSPTEAGYAAYTGYSPALGSIGTLVLPDMLGNPSRPDLPYVGASRAGSLFNYAEGAMYVGLASLLLLPFGAGSLRRSPATLFLVLLAVLALLMAFGTPVDSLLYFHVPGFGQSGSPGRALVLWAFACAGLAAFGLERLTGENGIATKRLVGGLALVALAAATAVMLGARMREGLGAGGWSADLGRQAGLVVICGGLIVLMAKDASRRQMGQVALVALATVDLLAVGLPYNPTSPKNEIYPETPLVAQFKSGAQHERIMPVNQGWSFAGPKAILPPNGAMVYGLRDVQGYDSLFPGQYKAFMNRMALPAPDASPQEVGNMVFAKNPASELPRLAGVRYVVSRTPLQIAGAKETFIDPDYLYELPSIQRAAVVSGSDREPADWVDDGINRVILDADGGVSGAQFLLADQIYPGWHATVDGAEIRIDRVDEVFRSVALPPGRRRVRIEFRPESFRLGLYLLCAAAAISAGVLCASRRR